MNLQHHRKEALAMLALQERTRAALNHVAVATEVTAAARRLPAARRVPAGRFADRQKGIRQAVWRSAQRAGADRSAAAAVVS